MISGRVFHGIRSSVSLLGTNGCLLGRYLLEDFHSSTVTMDHSHMTMSMASGMDGATATTMSLAPSATAAMSDMGGMDMGGGMGKCKISVRLPIGSLCA